MENLIESVLKSQFLNAFQCTELLSTIMQVQYIFYATYMQIIF